MKVRIPGVIAANGKWCVYGYPAAETDPDWPFLEETADNGDAESTYRRVWITVDLPVPETAEIVGECVPDPSS